MFVNRLIRWLESESQAYMALSVPASRSDDSIHDAEELLLEVDKVLDAGTFESRFTPPIVLRFKESSKQAQADLFIRLAIAGTIVYDLCLLIDAVIVPDVIGLAMFLQFGIGTPIAIAMMILISKYDFSVQYATMLTLVAMAGCTIAIFMASQASHVVLFPAFFVLFMLSANIVHTMPFKWALGFTILLIISVSVALIHHPSIDSVTAVFYIILLVTTAQYALSGNYRINTGMRRAYLFALRESLRVQLLLDSNIKLETMVAIDGLTGISNRRHFDRSLDEIWRRPGVEITILMIDIDNFKKLNDTYGHQVGDSCLRRVAQTLAEEVRDIGLCFRYGGEEFAAVFTDVGTDAAFAVAERLRRKVEALDVNATGSPLNVTVSIGCAACRPHRLLGTSDLVYAADAALYAAKSAGRNQTYVASSDRIGLMTPAHHEYRSSSDRVDLPLRGVG